MQASPFFMKNSLVTIFLFFIALGSSAQFVIEAERGKRLSDEYYQGSSLIYDCLNKHWVCVDRPNFEKCQKLRNETRVNKLLNLPCAPVKAFNSIDECVAEQNRQVTLPKIKDFCLFEEN